MSRKFAYAVDRAIIKARGTVRLRLQADTHVLDGARDDGVSNTSEGPGEVVLAVGKTRI